MDSHSTGASILGERAVSALLKAGCPTEAVELGARELVEAIVEVAEVDTTPGFESGVVTEPVDPMADEVGAIDIDRAGRGGGTSIKPGNLCLRPGRLVEAIAKGGLTIAGALQAPWMLPLAAIILWAEVYSAAKVELSEVEACVIWTVWCFADGNRQMLVGDLLALCNQEREKGGYGPLTDTELKRAVELLVRIGSIAVCSEDDEKVEIREWISVNYE